MFAIKSPSNYNEMLEKLNKSTFFTTLFFMVAMRFLDYIPLIVVPKELVPVISSGKDMISWAISFGVIPFFSACIAFFLSHSFEIHNKAAKLLQIRYAWERFYIVKPMARIAGTSISLDKKSVKKVMHGLYYPEVKNIDPHYVSLFWRYTQIFWVMFEHLLVVITFIVILLLINNEQSMTGLFYYLALMLGITIVQFLFVTAPKSADQVKQIPPEIICRFFRTEFGS